MPHPDHEKNRISWNDMVEVHFKHRDHNVKEFLEGDSSLEGVQKDIRIVEDEDPGYVQSHVEATQESHYMISDARTYIHPIDQRQIHLTVSQRYPSGGTPALPI